MYLFACCTSGSETPLRTSTHVANLVCTREPSRRYVARVLPKYAIPKRQVRLRGHVAPVTSEKQDTVVFIFIFYLDDFIDDSKNQSYFMH